MAERRMFAKTIIDSDAFLDLPMSSQNLYFHLSMRADDEGFINNPKRIMRMIGASDDDFKLLVAKSFLIIFDSGVVVIKHWKIHNYIRNDRFKETVYQEEKAMLSIKDNGAYTLEQSWLTDGIPNGYQMDTQDRIGKDSIDKVSIDKNRIGNNKRSSAEYLPDYPEANKAFIEFVKMRKTIKAPMSEESIARAISKLNKLATDALGGFNEEKAVRILNQSVDNCWKGLFELKEDKSKTSIVDKWADA